MKGKKITDAIHNLATQRDEMGDVYFIMFDQRKAFDRVNHKYLLNVLQHIGVQGDILGMTRTLYTGITSQVMVNGGKTPKMNKGQPF